MIMKFFPQRRMLNYRPSIFYWKRK